MNYFLVEKLRLFTKDERGDFGVKSIALAVAAVVVIGFVVLEITGGDSAESGLFYKVWDLIWQWIQDMMGTD